MNRHYTKQQYVALAQKIREQIPDISLTTDIIVGFPGETDEDVDDTIDVIKTVGFDNAFTFIYSKRTGTPAAAMEDQVAEEQVKRNFNRVLEVVQETARSRTAAFTGQDVTVLVEEINEHDSTLVTARMSNNTIVHLPGSPDMIGQLIKVHLDECHGFYYTGHAVI
jgi:tRNA-2-methylthio-N6-dimethylallyladenosine synthase